MVAFGTRPEAVKMAPVVHALKRRAEACQLRVCVTGQHRQMLDQVLEAFSIVPDEDLNLMRPGQDLAGLTARALAGMQEALRRWRPDLLLVHGDTTTTLAASLAAYYEKVPVGHVEAGLRTGDPYSPWPEEMNRRLTGALAAVHFAPTERARRNLLAEGVPPESVHVTGNTVVEALQAAAERVKEDRSLQERMAEEFPFLRPAPDGGRERRLVLVTGHRRESFGPDLERICRALRRLAERSDVEIVYPVHLNPQVQEPVHRILKGVPRLHLAPPLDYLPFVYLLSRAHFVLTDSGGIQEEAPSLGKPVLVTRAKTERPEAVAAGAARWVGADEEKIYAEASRLLDDPAAHRAMASAGNPFGDGKAAERIAAIVLAMEPA